MFLGIFGGIMLAALFATLTVVFAMGWDESGASKVAIGNAFGPFLVVFVVIPAWVYARRCIAKPPKERPSLQASNDD